MWSSGLLGSYIVEREKKNLYEVLLFVTNEYTACHNSDMNGKI